MTIVGTETVPRTVLWRLVFRNSVNPDLLIKIIKPSSVSSGEELLTPLKLSVDVHLPKVLRTLLASRLFLAGIHLTISTFLRF
jgi:hypothetical protein